MSVKSYKNVLCQSSLHACSFPPRLTDDPQHQVTATLTGVMDYGAYIYIMTTLPCFVDV